MQSYKAMTGYSRNSFRWFVYSLMLGCLGCAARRDRLDDAFNTTWQDDHGDSIGQVYDRLAGKSPPLAADVAIGTTSQGLVGVTLDSGQRFTSALKPDTPPVIVSDLVVLSSDGQVFALNARTGQQLWSLDAGGRQLRGAGDDGRLTLLSLGQPDLSKQSLLVAVNRQGSVIERISLAMPVGVPAVLDGVGFIPWGNQYVSALDLRQGEEIGRLLMREQVSHAVTIGKDLYFGQIGLTRFDERIPRASSGGARRMALPDRKLPGHPEWLLDGTQLHPVTSGARARIRLYARPALSGDSLSAAGERYAATYFRLAMGFDAKDAELIWVRTFDHDLLGGAAIENGFAFCDVKGNVWFVDSSGALEEQPVRMNAQLRSCVVKAEARTARPTRPAEPLTAELAEAVSLNDPEMVAAKHFLLTELGPIEDAVVTKVLIDLLSHPKTEPAIKRQAEDLLSRRTTGEEHMLKALEEHYDYLADELRTPPVGALADALARIKDPRAAPLLAKQLNDPANSARDMERAAEALVILATPGELEPLKTFFALYRATASDKETIHAVLAVARTLLRIGSSEGKTLLERAARESLTVKAVRQGLVTLLEGAEQAKKSVRPG